MNKRFLSVLLLISVLSIQISSQTGEFLIELSKELPGLPGLNAANPNLISSTDIETLNNLSGKVIEEEIEDIPKIEELFRQFCMEIVRLRNEKKLSFSSFVQRHDGICRAMVVGTGAALKSLNLAKKMIGVVGDIVISQEFDLVNEFGHTIRRVNIMNVEILQRLNSYKLKCWSVSPNCDLSQALRQLYPVQKRWINVRRDGVYLVARMVSLVQARPKVSTRILINDGVSSQSNQENGDEGNNQGKLTFIEN